MSSRATDIFAKTNESNFNSNDGQGCCNVIEESQSLAESIAQSLGENLQTLGDQRSQKAFPTEPLADPNRWGIDRHSESLIGVTPRGSIEAAEHDRLRYPSPGIAGPLDPKAPVGLDPLDDR